MFHCPVCNNDIDERKPEPRGSRPGPNRFRCVYCSWTWTEDALTENNAYLKISAMKLEFVKLIERLKQINRNPVIEQEQRINHLGGMSHFVNEPCPICLTDSPENLAKDYKG